VAVIEENDWTADVKEFLRVNLNDSYVSRFEDPSGIQPVTIKGLGADTQHDNEYVYMYHRITRLQEFSHELP
jgi:phage gp45-like